MKIYHSPIVVEVELHADDPDYLFLVLSKLFPGREWPLTLTTKDSERLEGAAAATSVVGNPFLLLCEQVRRFKKGVIIRADHEEKK